MKREQDVFCNMCSKKIRKKQDIPMEEFVSVKKTWGYFSEKDGMTQEFDLCEKCYDEFVCRFQIPVEQTEEKEIL